MKETSIGIAVAGSNGNNSGCSGSSAANSGPKMGSRRIFTPQFKLQVLESYRNDSDCKGNQRATARKYNIHRRQIQKWLQCESNLRSSVANINQNSVKHQFHNISHHHHHHPQQPIQVSINATDVSGSHYSHHHSHHQQQQRQHLSLDPTRHSVALSSLAVPSPRGGDGGGTSSTTATQGVLAAAVVAAAAAAGAAGAMAVVSAPTSTTKAAATTAINVVSPLRPTAIVGSSGRTVSPPSILHSHLPPHHHHHHHHYSMPYTHTPAVPVPVSVPILTHHISPHQPLHHYQYHNLSHHPHSTVTATALTQPQPQSQPSAFLSSVSLPMTILSSVAAKTANASISGNAIVHNEKIQNIDELRDMTATTTATATATGNSYVLCDGYENEGESCQEYVYKNYSKKYENIQRQTLSVAPIDLSLGPRRSYKEEIQHSTTKEVKTSQSKCSNVCSSNEKQNTQLVTNDGVIVDLTFRKRKVVTSTQISDDEQPGKLSKLLIDSTDDAFVKFEKEDYDTAAEEQEDDEEVDVDVEERTPPSKPIKLFKPYLLDEEVEDQNSHKKSTARAFYENGNEQRDPIIWSHHPACMSPNSYDSRQDSSRSSNFQTPPLDNKYNTFPVGSPYFPTNAIILSPTTSSLRCPKGSPVSGYESSSSTYSDTSCKKDAPICTSSRAFSIDLKLHPIYNDNMILNESHIQKWLDQDTVTTNQPAANTSIALCV